ncbi:MAG: DUF1778 domain-containing protein [Terracidiphilus sp.]|jgi:uncharacterized protein (DUF1778 family)
MKKTHRDVAISAPKAVTAHANPVATWTLSEQDFDAFAHSLLNPPEPNARMRAAVKRYKAMKAAQHLKSR